MSSKNPANKPNNKIRKKALILSSFMAVAAVVILSTLILSGANNIKGDNGSSLNETSLNNVASEVNETVSETEVISNDLGITIAKSEVTEEATFYPYQAGDTYMEVIAIRASDGTVRTALNTCQVCNGSGRGYYVQDGDVLVCQNCGNPFTVDQIEVVKGGCNPIPIFDGDKTQDAETISIPDEFMTNNKALFLNWKI